MPPSSSAATVSRHRAQREDVTLEANLTAMERPPLTCSCSRRADWKANVLGSGGLVLFATSFVTVVWLTSASR
jgi:hypothetical protein